MFKVIYKDGEINTYDHLEDFIKSVEDISEEIAAAIQIDYKHIRNEYDVIESGIHTKEYWYDELVEQLNLYKKDQEDEAHHNARESRSDIFI